MTVGDEVMFEWNPALFIPQRALAGNRVRFNTQTSTPPGLRDNRY